MPGENPLENKTRQSSLKFLLGMSKIVRLEISIVKVKMFNLKRALTILTILIYIAGALFILSGGLLIYAAFIISDSKAVMGGIFMIFAGLCLIVCFNWIFRRFVRIREK